MNIFFKFLILIISVIEIQCAFATDRLITCHGEALETTENDYETFRFNIRYDSQGHLKGAIYYTISNSSKTWKNLEIIDSSNSLKIVDNSKDPFELIISKSENYTTQEGITGALASFKTEFTESGIYSRFIVIAKSKMACEILKGFDF